jgi:hypothetical protein
MTFPQRAQGHEPALILARKWYQDGFALLQGRRPRPSPPHPIPKRSGPLLPPKRFLIAPIDILAVQGMVVGDCSWHGGVAPTSCPHFRESRPHHPLPIGSSLASPQSIASARSRIPSPRPQWPRRLWPPRRCPAISRACDWLRRCPTSPELRTQHVVAWSCDRRRAAPQGSTLHLTVAKTNKAADWGSLDITKWSFFVCARE